MKLSFATLGCPSWNLEQIAHQARAMGFDGVELRGIKGEHIGPAETVETLAQVKALFQQSGVAVGCIMGYSSFTLADPITRKENIDVAIQLVETARKLGCPTLRVFGGQVGEDGRAATLSRAIAGLKEVARVAEPAGVTLALETHDAWCAGADIRAVIEGVSSPAVRICWDIANSFLVEPIEQTFTAIREYIVHVHFKDAARKPDGSVHSVLPGTGEVDLARGLALLKSIGYKGYLSFEWEKRWEPELAEPEVAFPHYLQFTTRLMQAGGVSRG